MDMRSDPFSDARGSPTSSSTPLHDHRAPRPRLGRRSLIAASSPIEPATRTAPTRTTDESSPNRALAGEVAGAEGDGVGVAAAALVDAGADAVAVGVVGVGSLGLTPGEADGSADARGSPVFGSTVV